MTPTSDKFRDAANRIEEHLKKVWDQSSWFILRTEEENGIYSKHYIIHDPHCNEPMDMANEEYVTLMHPQVGMLLRDHLLKMKVWMDAKFVMPSDVVHSAELLADELLRDIYEEPEDEI